MSVIPLVLAQLGGSATRAEILRFTTLATLQSTLASGEITRLRRGVYGLPLTREAARAAEVGALLSHRSAALHHDLAVLHCPARPEAVISRGRSITVPEDLDLRFRSLPPSDISGPATSVLRTLVDCARDLPLAESLAVADSALRSGRLTAQDLAGAHLPRTGRARARRVLDLASALAANPFESGLRALAVEATDGIWLPQTPIAVGAARVLHADVGDAVARVALEADSHEFHKSRGDVVRDCHRYAEMTIAGWVVLRFAWEHVMFHQDWVRGVIACVVRQRGGVSRGSSRSA